VFHGSSLLPRGGLVEPYLRSKDVVKVMGLGCVARTRSIERAWERHSTTTTRDGTTGRDGDDDRWRCRWSSRAVWGG